MGRQVVPLAGATERAEWSATGLTLADDITFDEWLVLGDTLKRMDRAVQWWIGDWLNQGEQRWGEMYAQAIDETDAAYQTLRNYKWVAAAIPLSRRRDKLGFEVHKEIAALPDSERAPALERAAAEGWSVRDARKHVRALKHAANQSDPPPLPKGKYSVILADPPWRYEHMISESREIENHYPTMEIDEISALPVGSLAAEDCMLFLWTTAPHLKQAFVVLEAWGFDYRTNLAWVKPSIGPGYYVRTQHEHLLIARRGEPRVPESENKFPSVLEAPRGKHSEKPEAIYGLIEKAYPKARRVELFARASRKGWTSWGNERLSA